MGSSRHCWGPGLRSGGATLEWDRAEVAGRLEFLRRTDPGFARFGSSAHRYSLNRPSPNLRSRHSRPGTACRCPRTTGRSSWRSATEAPGRSTGSSAWTVPISPTGTVRTCCPASLPGPSPTRRLRVHGPTGPQRTPAGHALAGRAVQRHGHYPVRARLPHLVPAMAQGPRNATHPQIRDSCPSRPAAKAQMPQAGKVY